MPAIVRLAREEDIPILEQLFLQLSDWELQRREAVRRAIRDPNGEVLVAESDGEVVAFIHQVFFYDPLHTGLNSIITSLFVKQECRRKGIASQLLRKALRNAKTRKVIEVHVDTEEGNERAIRLYERHGFKKAGTIFEKNP